MNSGGNHSHAGDRREEEEEEEEGGRPGLGGRQGGGDSRRKFDGIKRTSADTLERWGEKKSREEGREERRENATGSALGRFEGAPPIPSHEMGRLGDEGEAKKEKTGGKKKIHARSMKPRESASR